MSKKIYLAYTGGTFGMMRTASGYQPHAGLAARLAGALPGGGLMPDYELHEYARLIDSANIEPLDWRVMAADIAARYDAFDGFVILHGTDTMAYTASALSFALAGLRKPVIITGAQIPLGEPRSDAAANLVSALLIAANHPVPEVCLYFGGRLLRGNRATKVASAAFDAFDSPNYPPLGRAGIDIEIDRRLVWEERGEEAFATQEAEPGEIAVLRLHPGLSLARLERLLEPPLAGLVMQSYGAGNGPVQLPGFLDALSHASARGVVIVNVTQCATGSVDQAKYATGSALAAAGVVGGYDMTVEAAFTKLDHLLARGLPAAEVRRLMQRNLRGECSAPATTPGGP